MIKIRNYAIYGGTFDPIHLGHIHLINWLLENDDFERVIVVPAGDPWQRSVAAAASDRLAMVHLAVSELVSNGSVEISDCEISRVGPSYALDTVREISRDYLSARFTWVLGSDAFASIDSWNKVEELGKLVDFLVIERPGSEIQKPKTQVKWRSAAIEALDISASEIRRAISAGRSLRGLVPDSVSDYIMDNGLYVAT